MTAAWHKVIRDVWRARTRATLVVLAIAIGLAGFLSMLSTYAVLRRELNRGYLATNPASAILFTDGIDDALLESVAARGDVRDADARRVLTVRVRTGPAEWRRMTLFVVRDFRHLRVSTITPEAGEWPPESGGLSIERDAFQVARTRIGDVVTVETAAGGPRTLRVTGRVHDAGQAQARMENAVYGYITPETLAGLGEAPVLDRLYLLAGGNRFDEAHVRQVAGDVKAWLESTGHIVRRTEVPPPGQHPHAAIMGVLLLAMAAFGMLALALSGVIVVNLLLATMAAERRQIGIMKALGGSRGQIARMYFAEAALLGGAALVLAVPAGVGGAGVLSQRFAALLNFDLTSLAAPAWVYLLVGGVGLIVPLAAAAGPVLAATAVTVREAVAAAGVNPVTFGAGHLDRLLCGMNGGGRPLLLGVRNSARRRARTALTLGTLSAAGAFFMAALNVRLSMMAALDKRFGAGSFGAVSRYAFDQHMLMIYVFLIAAAGVLAGVGCLGLMTATSLNVLDRRREIGILRAIGASPVMVVGIVVVEAVFIAVLAWGVAMLAAWPISSLIGSFLVAAMFRGGLDVAFSPAGIVGWLAISSALAAVSSLVPAMGALRHPVPESINYE